MENLLESWREFVRGKRGRKDTQAFELNLMDNIFSLRRDLAAKTYRHAPYHAFNISDPKPRNIHKASVRDRLLHRALYRVLYPFFDRIFISDSYSCRENKGTHKAINKFRDYTRQESFNHTRTVWVLKCDVTRFFAAIDQAVLMNILRQHILCPDIFWLISRIVSSFHSNEEGKGLPLGNLMSQLLVNVYMNEFDQFVKHRLKARCYIRYADDFIILSRDRTWLLGILPEMDNFLSDMLHLRLHPNKISISTVASGVDFLGWIHFPTHRVLRTTTKKRILRRIKECPADYTLHSYLGLIKHGDTYRLQEEIINYHGLCGEKF